MNIINAMRGITGVQNELNSLREERQAVQVKIGAMSHTPKHMPEYSSARLDDWSRAVKKYDEQEQALLERIQELKSEPKYLAAREAKQLELREKRDALQKELDECQKLYTQKRLDASYALLDGGDVIKLSGELTDIRERADRLERAVSVIVDALRLNGM